MFSYNTKIILLTITLFIFTHTVFADTDSTKNTEASKSTLSKAKDSWIQDSKAFIIMTDTDIYTLNEDYYISNGGFVDEGFFRHRLEDKDASAKWITINPKALNKNLCEIRPGEVVLLEVKGQWKAGEGNHPWLGPKGSTSEQYNGLNKWCLILRLRDVKSFKRTGYGYGKDGNLGPYQPLHTKIGEMWWEYNSTYVDVLMNDDFYFDNVNKPGDPMKVRFTTVVVPPNTKYDPIPLK